MSDTICIFLSLTGIAYLVTVFSRFRQLFPKTYEEESIRRIPDHLPQFMVVLVAIAVIGFGKVQILNTTLAYIAVGLFAIAYWPVMIHAWLQPCRPADEKITQTGS